MRHDFGVGEAIVRRWLEDGHLAPCDFRAPQAPEQFFALSGEHRAADDLDPTGFTIQSVQISMFAYGFMIFKQRRIEPEVLDHVPPEVARPNLADLVRINRNFGGQSVLRRTLERVINPKDSTTILDVGAASGDSVSVIKAAYPLARVTALDLHWTNLEGAPQPKLIADAFELPFPEGSFDYVLCSLFLHHFGDEEVQQLLRGFYCVAKRAVAVCDLERHILPYLFLPATRQIFGWNEITVADGLKSVRASFRVQELVAIAKAAGLSKTEAYVYRPAFRIGMIARKE